MLKLNRKKVIYKSLIVLLFSNFIISCGGDSAAEEIVAEPDEEPIEDVIKTPNYNLDSITVYSVPQLRLAAIRRNKVITMEPGEYTIEGTMPEDPKTIIHFLGSNNKFIFKDVKIITPTTVLRDMGPGSVHEFATFRFDGSDITFEGGTFENTGWEAPARSLAEFEVQGNNISFLGCTIHIQGSSPYGYGDYFGKGSDSNINLQKHSAMSILGDNVLVEDCDFKVFAFGHGIHIHGSQNTVIRGVTMEGERRLTDEILAETEGPAFDRDFKIYFPSERRGQTIPSGQMLSLTEDGIRAYLEGDDINGENRRTQNITVEDCVVDKMRGGITLAIGNGDIIVKNNISINNEHAYSFPSNSVATNNKGNVAYGPLLYLPYDHKRSSQIEIELIDPNEGTMGPHNFADIVGNSNNIIFTYNGDNPDANLRPIMIGVPTDYGTDDEDVDPDTAEDGYNANDNKIDNQTKNPIVLGEYSSGTTGTTNGEITSDAGTNNNITAVTK